MTKNNLDSFITNVLWFAVAMWMLSGVSMAKVVAHGDYEPANLKPNGVEQWLKLPRELQGSFGSIDVHYDRNEVPELNTTRSWSGTGWRGERVYAQIVMYSAVDVNQVRFSRTDLSGEKGKTITSSNVKVNFLRYTLSDDGSQACGKTEENKPVFLVPDIIDNAKILDMPAGSVRPVWVAIDIPSKTKPGKYVGHVIVSSHGLDDIAFEIQLEVLSPLLPPPSKWSFYLDLWQNPWSVARFHDVEPWSDEHWLLLDPLIRNLAEAGQKCITTTIIHAAWGGQTYDEYGSMVEWMKKANGQWSFDYKVFDQYVEFCQKRGIKKQINCYSLAPWGSKVRYLDQASGDYVTVEAEPGSKVFMNLWKPFLVDFVKHLKSKGWLGRTAIAMDERPEETMAKVIKLIKEASPKLNIALAGEFHATLDTDIHDLCIAVNGHNEEIFKAVQSRSEQSRVTAFYVACGNDKPNNFTYSPPAESTWVGWYAAAKGFDGFLRWAYNSWVENPLFDTRHVTFPAGDCFMIYPGARSSVRFEHLRDGIEDFEKIMILKKKLKGNDLKKLQDTLEGISYPQEPACSETISAARKVLVELSRKK